jgi:chromosome segregation ATPase
MTKEELKQEAEESFEQYKVTDEDYVVSPYSDDMGEKMLMYNYEYYAEETYLRLYTQGYIAGAEPREKRIAELEERVWRQKKKIVEKTKKIADLEKENAELRKDKKELCHSISEGGKACVYLNEQLTKAKEIIKYLCGMVRELNNPNVQLTNVDYSLSEAEQFLSEVEK